MKKEPFCNCIGCKFKPERRWVRIPLRLLIFVIDTMPFKFLLRPIFRNFIMVELLVASLATKPLGKSIKEWEWPTLNNLLPKVSWMMKVWGSSRFEHGLNYLYNMKTLNHANCVCLHFFNLPSYTKKGKTIWKLKVAFADGGNRTRAVGTASECAPLRLSPLNTYLEAVAWLWAENRYFDINAI